MNISYYDSEFGRIGIAENNGKITNLFFEGEKTPDGFEEFETDLLREASRQLKRYFSGELKDFDLPLEPKGTEFMKSVWKALLEIPYGETATYKAIAEKIGNPKACRAVGMANNKNPIAIIIPCHRVIGADGSLTGYYGGLDFKKRLLELEREK